MKVFDSSFFYKKNEFLNLLLTNRKMTNSTIASENSLNKDQKLRVKLPNTLMTSKYYMRYQNTQNALFIGMLFNVVLAVTYCESDMVDADFQGWFLWAGYYFHFLCIILVIANAKAHYDYHRLYERQKIKNIILNIAIKIIFLLPRPYPQLEDELITFSLEAHANQNELPQTHKINNILTVLGLGQSFFLFIYLFNNSGLKNDRSHRICSLFNCKVSNMWVIRGWFKKNHLLKLFAIFFAWSLVCAICFRLVEYRQNPQILYIQNAIWLTFSTMFCIGYGDLVTQTNVGKWIGLIAMYTGVIFTYFSITLINNFFKLQSQEKKTLNLLIILENKKQLRYKASQYIRQALWRSWRNRQNREFGIYFPETIKEINSGDK